MHYSGQHPLTTEEPVHTSDQHHETLVQEMQHLNKLETPLVSPAIIQDKPDPNILLLSSEDEQTPTDEREVFLSSPSSSDEDEEDLIQQERLWQTTEANKHIPFTQDMTPDTSSPSSKKSQLRRASTTKRKGERGKQLLVFSEPSLIQKNDRYIVTMMYGAGSTGTMLLDEEDMTPRRRSRAYMVACDFSDESFYAMEWVMGTMMRDGDELHIVAAVNREDNPDAVKKAGLSLKSELKMGSEKVTEMAKSVLGQMLLFNIKVRTYTIVGRIKDVLYNMILSLPLTLVVCGSRGRNSVKGLFMGSISTFLVHKSPVPVSVIRKPSSKEPKIKKKKKVKSAPPLSESVKTGALAVDELQQQKS
ncbi:uncharacterized protein BX664DRAFT_341573 [Halteromyces radiatus]|uniref:uncharacterized protein n=1 Tax=Halteromyces radiatus TaxID=101107 RepID=UPI00221FD06A|nr:uncharacterized protein BX664DRAFT_341573 [Halteromyces radiatus]KAI8079834.1 hypothetical protein BX664DRAFT_341573 [Halteromyces radiatus]